MSSESSNGSNGLGDTGTVVLEDKPDLKEPPMYQVVLLNDDFTPMEFVVYILQSIFGYEHERSTQIMLAVHTKGKGVCGIFPNCLLYTSPSPRDATLSRMPSSA